LDRSSVEVVVEDIKAMAKVFISASFIHVKWSLNEASHTLAKSCVNVNSSEVFHSVPDCIGETLCIDVI
jgi:hypothetical protein